MWRTSPTQSQNEARALLAVGGVVACCLRAFLGGSMLLLLLSILLLLLLLLLMLLMLLGTATAPAPTPLLLLGVCCCCCCGLLWSPCLQRVCISETVSSKNLHFRSCDKDVAALQSGHLASCSRTDS
jgi:hypothetical protein